MGEFPIPDLMVEIDISPPKVDRDGIYSKLQPPEVWKLSNDVVSIETARRQWQLRRGRREPVLVCAGRSGNRVAASRAESEKRPAWKRAIREWARDELRPRAGI